MLLYVYMGFQSTSLIKASILQNIYFYDFFIISIKKKICLMIRQKPDNVNQYVFKTRSFFKTTNTSTKVVPRTKIQKISYFSIIIPRIPLSNKSRSLEINYLFGTITCYFPNEKLHKK